MAAAALGMVAPPVEAGCVPVLQLQEARCVPVLQLQEAGDVVLEVATLDGAAQVELTTPAGSSTSGPGPREGEISPEEIGGPAAAMPSEGEIPQAASEVDRLKGEIHGEIERVKLVQEVRGSKELPCIWRVHPSIRETEKEAYEPKLVSIGPLHRDNKILQPMEEIKLMYLDDLLGRSNRNELGNYIRVISNCEQRARMQYAEAVPLSRDDFVKMLVVDGCFIIEYFAKRVFKKAQETAPLSGVRWGFSHLRRDLMLLENQIPFFVLAKLSEETDIPFIGKRQRPLTLMDLALGFLRIKLSAEKRPQADRVLHLLHLHHLCLNPSAGAEEPTAQHSPHGQVEHQVPRMIPNATELDKAGVKFMKKDGASSHLMVSFLNGLLEIPFLPVEEATSTRLRNFIALEQCCPQVGNYFTSYGVFMDNIVSAESDVALLRKHRVIESKLGSDEEVAKMFNMLCKGTHLNYGTHYNARLFVDVNAYCEVARHRWRASLKSTHLSSPWTIISLLAGIVLLALTIVQTVYTIIK
ncbi:hypothetical protein Taro_038925 [Colocasia esculenta]|uniref:Uncharacterized protein n=1 Tax=Colocasia esculenta TaxID=4460 RepID=A0A843WF70_COLES|nr:hypothetical protein [Colocasia esculenta]